MRWLLSGIGAEGLSLGLLMAILVFAVRRPWGLPEAVVAVPAALVVVGVGALTPAAAGASLARLLPVVAFLAAVLMLAQRCDDEGLFVAAGDLLARACRGEPQRLLAGVFVLAGATTAVLSLDATVVLLTPVVLATAERVGARPRAAVYACTHLANAASLLLPVSNLTNLLAFAASGLSFARFAVLMAPGWLITVAAEYVLLRRYFAADLLPAARGRAGDGPARAAAGAVTPGPPGPPWFAVATLAVTLAGFVLTSLIGLGPVWAAVAGTAVLAVRALRRGRVRPGGLLASASPAFLVFVLALGVVVQAVLRNGLAGVAKRGLPAGDGLLSLLLIAAAAAALANLINNLPAVLALLPVVASSTPGPGAVLAVLIGVNLGPNLTYAGSLATLLWRRVLREHGDEPSLRDYTRLGLLTVPVTIGLATLALWVTLRLVGT